MKKIVLVLVFFISAVFTGIAQKYAYVDSEYILGNIPAYKSAQSKLDEYSVNWQKEIEAMYTQIDKMYKDFQSEKVLLSEDMKTKRENEIVQKEKDAKDLQKKYFGKDGELYKKRQELIKPIQDDVFNAVKQIAIEGNWAIIFDTANTSVVMLYVDPKYDKSEDVLKKLGFKK
jgi:outer membrane protein